MSTSSPRETAGTELTLDLEGALEEGLDLGPGASPWRLAWRRLRRNHVALFFGVLFLVIVVMCLLAPVYAQDIAHHNPDVGNITGTVKIGNKTENIVSATGIPIGPTWSFTKYFLGADANGRDTAVRLLYGGRNSLLIGAEATIITMVIAIVLGLIAGYFRGITDGIISRCMDILWSIPALLLGITLGTMIAVGGIGPIKGNHLWIPSIVIGIVYIPYVAKPIRGQVLQLRERDFIDAARQQGLSHTRIMFGEILPNLSSTIVVFVPLILANAILLEAGLSYLGVGVQPPNPSWGNMISDGLNYIPAAFSDVLAPGIMLVLAVLSMNLFGDGIRDALDPRSKIRIDH
ncbi:MAG TPA: ABC transporter permease [Solirubrobacteraceae bacterium]|nr:ABC transporter permease [Solirubrobacteraceae bacterium]